MNILILGAAGFIGTNLVIELLKDSQNRLTLVDEKPEYFAAYPAEAAGRVSFKYTLFNEATDFEGILQGQDIIYHLISTNNPTSSNKNIEKEITDNIIISVKLLEACVSNHIKKIIFISSGGTVYGNTTMCPIQEDTQTNPITTYGIQKLTIEKLIYLYSYLYGIDYRIIRLSNPYGPYQRPNGKLGVVTTFLFKAINNYEIDVFGDGTVIRDYIYISDAVRGIMTIVKGNSRYKIFNLGSGIGTSINEILNMIRNELHIPIRVNYTKKRAVDVAVNILDISRYEAEFGLLRPMPLPEGMKRTLLFLKQ